MQIQIRAAAVFVTMIISLIIGYLSIDYFEDYGWTVFVLIPFLIGFLPPFIIGRTQQISRIQSYRISFLTLLFSCAILLVFAFEGLICIAMASPLLALLTLVGSYLAYKFHKGKMVNSTNVIIVLLASSATFMSFDRVNKTDNVIPVTTSIIITAPIEDVWHNVVTFNTIAAPTEWLFKTGVAYTTDATIEGKGVGAIRYCNFTTGPFIEPITKWEEPYLLAFDVVEQPAPMQEFNPFWEIHPPHLDGYFKSQRGEFNLKQISNTETEIIGTTWYTLDITPYFYWRIWTDFIIHKIHLRVLNHIKKETEEKNNN